jgi:hypothetical protein
MKQVQIKRVEVKRERKDEPFPPFWLPDGAEVLDVSISGLNMTVFFVETRIRGVAAATQ